MKQNRHPEIHELTARCACGNSFDTISTKSDMNVPICGNCHPFYTGEQKMLDTAGRIEKFNKRFQKGAKKA